MTGNQLRSVVYQLHTIREQYYDLFTPELLLFYAYNGRKLEAMLRSFNEVDDKISRSHDVDRKRSELFNLDCTIEVGTYTDSMLNDLRKINIPISVMDAVNYFMGGDHQ